MDSLVQTMVEITVDVLGLSSSSFSFAVAVTMVVSSVVTAVVIAVAAASGLSSFFSYLVTALAQTTMTAVADVDANY